MNNKSYKFVFLLASAVSSSNIANIINSEDTIFIGTENFGSSVNQSFYIRLKNKATKAYFVRNLDYLKCKLSLQLFKDNYISTFKTEPTILSAYTYDAVSLILKTYKSYGIVNTNNVLKTTFTGITGINLKKGKFSRSNKFIILSVNRSGYDCEE